MELLDYISRKFNVSRKLLESVLHVRPEFYYSNQELVTLCTEHKIPVALPEIDDNSYILLAASRMFNVGGTYIVSHSAFKKFVRLPQSEEIWRHYTSHIFDGLDVNRLYINNVRVDFTKSKGVGNTLHFYIDGKYPLQSDFNHLNDTLIFINDTLYNAVKVSVLSGGLVFIWTTP